MTAEPPEEMMSGFGSHFATEAVAGALPLGRNSPQRPAFGLYAEQLSGTAFTAPRAENRRSWLYRMRPSAAHPPYARYEGADLFAPGTPDEPLPPNRLRWDPLAFPDGADRLRRRPGHDDGESRSRRSRGRRRPYLPRQRRHGRPLFLRRRRRAADHPRAGPARPSHRDGPDRDRAGRGRADPARRALPGAAAGRRRRAAMSPRITAPSSACPSSARSAPTASPIRATS